MLTSMIVSYRDKRTRDFSAGKRINAFSGFARSAGLKLDRLEAANSLRDLAALPGNRFEDLPLTETASTVSVSTISGGFALFGTTRHPGLQTWRLLTVTRRIYGNHRYSSRRTLGRRTGRSQHERRRIGAQNGCANQPRHANLERRAWHYWRHCLASRPFLWHQRSVLAQSADTLRFTRGPPEEREIHQDVANSKTLRTGPSVSFGFAPGSRATQTSGLDAHRVEASNILNTLDANFVL